jgi:trk system potassium uptake protein
VKLKGRRLGDERVRIELVKPVAYRVKPPPRIRRAPPPAALLVLGFGALTLVGTLLLMLPFASATGDWTPFVDALFTATSAVCVTGLVVLDTGTYWSPTGHVIVLTLIQVGGFGFMTGSTLLLFLLVGRRTGLRDRVLVQASTGIPDLGSVTSIVRRVAVFTLIVEGIGWAVLTVAFLGRGWDPLGAAWFGLFHSISAFNNAGFDLMGNFQSLNQFRDDFLILGTIGVQLILGGLGVAIIGDLIAKRRWHRLALETKVVVLISAVLLFGGALLIGLIEWENPATLGALPEGQRVLNAAFESATLRTAGFSALPTAELTAATLFIVMALMFIGGASGSTAGGIKVNTFGVLLVAILSSVRGNPSAQAFGRRIPHAVVYRAISVALLGIASVFLVGLTIELSMETTFVAGLFEAVSAVGTVGASTGITPDLPTPARLVVILAMFAGRLGPLTLVLALAARVRPVSYRPAVETMRIG